MLLLVSLLSSYLTSFRISLSYVVVSLETFDDIRGLHARHARSTLNNRGGRSGDVDAENFLDDLAVWIGCDEVNLLDRRVRNPAVLSYT